MLNVANIREDEGLFGVESESNDVFNVVDAHLDGAFLTFKLILWLVDVFLIIGDLDDQRHIKGLLQVLSEQEGNSVTHVQCVSTGTSTSVKVEGLLLLVGV